MRTTPAHSDLIARLAPRLGGSSAASIISYRDTAGQSLFALRGYATDFRNSPEATRRTFELMRGLVWAAQGKPTIYNAARAVRAMANQQNEPLVVALFRWVKMNVGYMPDEEQIEQGREGRELLIAPDLLLAMNPALGDCDDFSMVVAAIAIQLGLRVKFVAVALEGENPSRYGHVYTQVLDAVGENGMGPKQWVSLDCSHGPWVDWHVGLTRPVYAVFETTV